MRVLGIETSCDETSAAVIDGDGTSPAQIRSLVILSQDVHGVFGGVVPEIASREHLRAVVPVTDAALAQAGVTLSEIDAIAVTAGPGLVGALLVGVSYAKALALRLQVPLIGVHHMEGHLFATALESPDAVPPFTALLVSGGHTLLVDVPAWGEYQILGSTRDDAAGEAFDKAAKLLDLGYPGGPAIERLAREVSPEAGVKFPRPMLHGGQRRGDADWYDVSFSGLKTAVRLAVTAAREAGTLESTKPAIARGFQDAVVDTLAAKTARAVRDYARPRVVLGGGVAGNRALVEAVRVACGRQVQVFAPASRLATDNAAMIAAAGAWRLSRGERSGVDLMAFAGGGLPGTS
ncbi:MAG: tRNA (adenosine(37)-N6)-threonylcarbamoyltransferase complex transferase subunit TsaD [Gemmatimonadaceae bacterium]|nr:tRNA (adenosine(37)-N6)-threonylcarbamoyltransferase complex transferase subunit TsaD [Gemmatimonadaceae bacterium]